MTFIVAYRDRDGARREEAVEAADRAACVSLCKARGIAPMGIREGCGRARATSPGGRGTQGIGRWVVASVLVAAAIGGAWWWARPAAAPVPERPAERPPPARKAGTPAAGVAAKATVSTDGVERVIHTPMGEKRVKMRYSKAALAALASANTPPIQDFRAPPPDPDAPPPPPPRYRNNLQLQLSEYAWSGRFVGVPDPISNKEARKLVEEPVEFLPEDTPEVRKEKETVAALQKELKEYMANGGRANDYLMQLMRRQDAEQETIREAKRQIRELCKNGDVELAEQARDKFNEYLKEKGLPPILMSNYLKQARKRAAEGKPTDGTGR